MSENDLSVERSWDGFLAKPHEWWDNRLNTHNPIDAAFEHKFNGELLRIDDSTPEWLRLKLESLTFDNKIMQKCQNSVSMTKDGESVECCWRDLVDNPKKWRDHREHKLVKPRHPDFKHKDGGQSLWLNNAPKWIFSKLGDLEFDVQIHKSGQQKDDNEEESWKDLVENPDRWWDNRSDKFKEKSPDFKHKDSGKVLWLNKSPAWVLHKLPPSKPKQDIGISKKATLLS